MAENKQHLTYNGKKNFADVPQFINEDGEYLFCRYYEPEGEVKGLLQLIHPWGGHCGVFDNVADVANKLGMVMFAHDHYGNGESEGERGNSFNYIKHVRDSLKHTEIMREKYPDVPVYLYGHSQGGALALFAAQQNPSTISGMILSAPGIAPSPESVKPYQEFVVRVVGKLLPFLPIGSLQYELISRNPEARQAYIDDPMIVDASTTIGIAKSYLDMMDALRKILPEIKTPYFLAHGDDDKICDIGGSKLLHELSITEDKTFKIYPGMRHMLEHELEGDTKMYLEDVKSWLTERLSK